MDKVNLQPLRGFRDFLPKEKTFQSWFYKNLKEVSASFGFEEYDGPTIEPLALYAAKSGEELVKRQAFTFKDKSETEVALRPEMTPTLARIVAANEGTLVFPLKWYTYGSRFRYEAPQKGRGREFFQWDVDILGVKSSEADAEILMIAAKFYEKLGLASDEVVIKINDRTLLSQNLKKSGVPDNKIVPIFKIIDKKNKIDQKSFTTLLKQEGILDNTVEKIIKLLSNYDLYKESKNLLKILEILSDAGIDKYVQFDPSIVRGLDYYTGIVFEGQELSGKFRSIWGGGRYDNLTSQVGSAQEISGVGFAMGDMVMEEVLKIYNKYPNLSDNYTKVLVTVFSPELYLLSSKLAQKLRSEGINTDLYPDPSAKLDKQLKYADKKGIPYAVILGPEEVASDTITVKNLRTQSQKRVFINAISSVISD